MPDREIVRIWPRSICNLPREGGGGNVDFERGHTLGDYQKLPKY